MIIMNVAFILKGLSELYENVLHIENVNGNILNRIKCTLKSAP